MAFDVAVVGAGVIGRSCAWRLAQQGHSVVLFDAYPGSGASYVAAGMLAPVTEAAYGEEALTAVTVHSANAWPSFAAHLREASGLDPGYRATGTLMVGADASDRVHLEELFAFHRHLGLPSRLVTPSEARAIEPLLTPSTRGGIFAEGDAQVDNRRLLGALAVAGGRLGVSERREAVREVVVAHDRVVAVRTDGGSEDVGAIVLAAGFGSVAVAGLPPVWAPPTRPIKGQILRLRQPLDRPALTATVRAVVGGFSVYIVPRSDGRVVVGATQEDVGPDVTVTAGGVYTLLRDALRVLPALSEYELIESQAGLRPGSPDNAAIVGATGIAGLFIATGHHRNGILLAPVTTEVIAAVVGGGAAPGYALPLDPARFARVPSTPA